MSENEIEAVEWDDLAQVMPWMWHDGVHAIPARKGEETIQGLRSLGFSIYVLEGSRIVSSDTFIEEAVRVFPLPSYCGHNWDALYDVLPDIELPDEYWKQQSKLSGRDVRKFDRKVAVIWRDADTIIANDLIVLLTAVEIFRAVNSFSDGRVPNIRLELVLLGVGTGFKEATGWK